MSVSLFGFLSSIQEFRTWGANAPTLGFLLVIGLTFWPQIPGALDQVREVWPENANTKGLSGAMLFITLGYFFAFAAYSIATHAAGGIFNSICLTPFFVALLARIWRLRGFAWFEWIAAGWCVAVAIAIVAADIRFVYAAAAIAAVVGTATQPLLMIVRKTSAGANKKFLFRFAWTSVVWMFYTAAIGDRFMFPVCTAVALLYGAAWLLCFKYPSPEKKEAAA